MRSREFTGTGCDAAGLAYYDPEVVGPSVPPQAWSKLRMVTFRPRQKDRRYGGHFVLTEAMVGDTGLEPVTSCMSSKCSNQLS